MINLELLNRRIFIIGNSHVHQFTGAKPADRFFFSDKIIAINLGPITAYKFGEKYIHEAYGRLNEFRFNPQTDILITTIGEIDCRYHLLKQIINHNRPMNLVVQECAYRYFAAHIHLQKNIPGLKSFIMGINPSHSHGPCENVFGEMIQRNEITKMFNKELKEFCEITKNIKFFSIYDYLIHPNGSTKTELFLEDDWVHYNHYKIVDYLNIELDKILCL